MRRFLTFFSLLPLYLLRPTTTFFIILSHFSPSVFCCCCWARFLWLFFPHSFLIFLPVKMQITLEYYFLTFQNSLSSIRLSFHFFFFAFALCTSHTAHSKKIIQNFTNLNSRKRNSDSPRGAFIVTSHGRGFSNVDTIYVGSWERKKNFIYDIYTIFLSIFLHFFLSFIHRFSLIRVSIHFLNLFFSIRLRGQHTIQLFTTHSIYACGRWTDLDIDRQSWASRASEFFFISSHSSKMFPATHVKVISWLESMTRFIRSSPEYFRCWRIF